MEKTFEQVLDEMRSDKSEGSLYYAWQANIAMAFKDTYEEAEDKTDIHKIANDAAKRFLGILLIKS